MPRPPAGFSHNPFTRNLHLFSSMFYLNYNDHLILATSRYQGLSASGRYTNDATGCQPGTPSTYFTSTSVKKCPIRWLFPGKTYSNKASFPLGPFHTSIPCLPPSHQLLLTGFSLRGILPIQSLVQPTFVLSFFEALQSSTLPRVFPQ
jgi:hypothetical protein